MRQKLINLIDKYEKKKYLNVTNSQIDYYQGKIDAYEQMLKMLEANGGDN